MQFTEGFLPPATKLGQGNIFRSVCQEFCPGGAFVAGGMHGRGACVAGGMCIAGGMHGRGHAWQRGMHGRGACMVGGMCGSGGVCVWWGACVAGGCAWQILRDTVNERAVHILLECILVMGFFGPRRSIVSVTDLVSDLDGLVHRLFSLLQRVLRAQFIVSSTVIPTGK